MRVSTLSPTVLHTPRINAGDARWAAEALASLVRQLESDSVIAVVLQRTQRELQSLAAGPVSTRTADGSEVNGPVRIRM